MGKKHRAKRDDDRDDAEAATAAPSTAGWAAEREARDGRPAELLSARTRLPDPYPAYRAAPGRPMRLADLDPDDTGEFESKDDASSELKEQKRRIRDLQARLYAERKQSLLIVLQAIDTGGKDGTIHSVFEGVNPQGCQVWSFKAPSEEELAHDFLWRYHAKTPARGMIAIFNRSHYEDVLIVRVKGLVPEAVWERRYDAINAFEEMLAQNRTTVLKFFLHISKHEQKKRLESRLTHPDKNWKFDSADLRERARWDGYQVAFEDAINRCSTPDAPWTVVPANHKWYRNLVVARTIADTLEAMDPQFPEPAEGLENIEVPD